MANEITLKALQDASLDAKSLEEVVNGSETKQVTTRLGETYPSVKKAIKTMFENGGLPATPFKTKALMTASALVNGDYAMVTDDPVNNGLYVKTAGAWVKSGYDTAKTVMDTIYPNLFEDTPTEIAPITTIGFYRWQDGVFNPNSALVTTGLIDVKKGMTIWYGLRAPEALGGSTAVVSIYDVTGVFTGFSEKLDAYTGFFEGYYTAKADGKVAVSSYKGKSGDNIYVKRGYAVQNRVEDLSVATSAIVVDNIFKYSDPTNFNSAPYDVRNKFWRSSGELLSLSPFFSTDYIPVNPTDVLNIFALAGGQSSSILNVYDEDKKFVECVYESTLTPFEWVTLEYVVENKGYVTSSSYAAEEYLLGNEPSMLIAPEARKVLTPANIKEYISNGDEETPVITGGDFILSGASFAYASNYWFELLCKQLGKKPINKAVSGHSIANLASQLINNEFYTQESLNSTDALIIMHVWNFSVTARKDINVLGVDYTDEQMELWSASDYENNIGAWLLDAGTLGDTETSILWDYCLKKLQVIFYAEKDNELSKWYGTTHGKPFTVFITTHWHDARVDYNTSIRELCAKWGLPLIKFDENIGFSKDKPHVSGVQHSRLYERGGNNPEVINGVTYGWHYQGGKDEPLVHRMASIAKDTVKRIVM